VDRWDHVEIASTRLIEALRAAEVTGYRTFDVEVRDHPGSPIEGYTGFATDPSPGADIQNLYDQTGQNYAFIATRRVVEALHGHGADRLDISPYNPGLTASGWDADRSACVLKRRLQDHGVTLPQADV
jgi:hypothetical protein